LAYALSFFTASSS